LAQGTYGPTNAQITGFTGQFTIQLGSDPAQTIEFGNGATGEITTRAGLVARLAEINTALTGVTLSVNGSNFLNVASTSSENLTISGAAPASFGIVSNTYAPTATVTDNASRASLQSDFNNLLTQITQLARDASYNGVNLLDSDNLTVTFNEDGSSSLAIAGVTFSAAGLGLTSISGAGFQSNANVQAALTAIDGATATLRSQAAKFGSNLSIVQARQDFTKNMISVLQIGADNLVLADTNEEGANMLALNTRQQLSTTALSLAARADQNVLRLF
jgi:flagellin-like hook-associated protein FlgL